MTDEHGAPIQNARVRFRIRPATPDANGDEPEPTVHDTEWATTDAYGNYASEPLPPGTYALGAEHYEHLDAEERTVEVPARRTTSSTNLIMEDGEAIAGRVTDWDGNPVPGAEVSARTERKFDYRYSAVVSAVTTEGPFYFRGAVVGDDGAFLLRGLQPGPYELRTHATGFFPFLKTYSAPAEGVTVTLRPLPRITGRVVDKRTGEPMEVFGVAHDDVPSATERHPDGRFEIILYPGEYTICVSAPGYAIATVKNVRAIEGVEPDGLLFELVAGATLRFHVTSEETGKAIEGAVLQLERDWAASGFGEPPERRRLELFLSDPAGASSAERFPPGRHAFTVSHPEFALKQIVVEIGEEEPEKTVEVALNKGLTIRGRVVSKAEGTALPGAKVKLLDGATRLWVFPDDDVYFPRLDESGAFKIERLTPGGYTLSVWHEGYATFRQEMHLDDHIEKELFIELAALGRIVVTLRTSDGAPATDASVLYSRESRAEPDAEGKCVIDDRDPGLNWFSVERYSRAARESVGVLVRSGEETHVDVVLGDRAVFGRLTSGGQPLGDASVEIYPFPHSFLNIAACYGFAMTDAEGRYRIEGLRPGAYLVSPDTSGLLIAGDKRGLVPDDRTVVVGDEDVRLDIELDETEKGHVAGLVRMPDGRPAAEAFVFLVLEPAGDDRPANLVRAYRARPLWSHSNEEGRFTLSDVDPGSYRLIAWKHGYAAPVVRIEKEARSDISDLEITLQRDSVIVAHLHADHGEIPRQIWIAVCDEQGRVITAWPRAVDRETNTCLVGSLWPGRFNLVAAAYGYALSRGQADVGKGESTHLDLDLVKGHRLAVVALDNSATPVPAAQVVLDSGDPISLAVLLIKQAEVKTTNENGRTTLDHVADGDYTVRVLADGYEPGAAPVRIAGADEQITVTLKPAKPSTQ